MFVGFVAWFDELHDAGSEGRGTWMEPPLRHRFFDSRLGVARFDDFTPFGCLKMMGKHRKPRETIGNHGKP